MPPNAHGLSVLDRQLTDQGRERLQLAPADPEFVHDRLEGRAVSLDLGAELRQRRPELRIALVAAAQAARQLDTQGCPRQVVIEVDRQ